MRVDSDSFAPASASGFIVLEGVNGAGKTTLQTRLADFIKSKGHKAVITREPGSTALGKTLRSLVLEHPKEAPCEMAELFIFAADRAQHVDRVIRPATERGEWVISDRYLYSTVAFQGYGRGIDQNIVTQITKLAVSGVYPDLVLLLDLDAAAGLRRTQKRGTEPAAGEDKFEKETLEFHKRIREGFLTIAQQSQQAFAVLDASKTPDQIFEAARPYLEILLRAPRAKKP